MREFSETERQAAVQHPSSRWMSFATPAPARALKPSKEMIAKPALPMWFGESSQKRDRKSCANGSRQVRLDPLALGKARSHAIALQETD
jgi:hypothetical protein